MVEWGIAFVGIIITFNFFLAAAVAMRGLGDRANALFVVMVTTMNTWIFSNFFENEIDIVGAPAAEFFLRFDFATAIIFFFLLSLFAAFFLSKGRAPRWYLTIVWAAPSASLAVLSFTDTVIKNVRFVDGLIRYDDGPALIVYAAAAFGYLGSSIWILFRRAMRLGGTEKKQIFLVLAGLAIALINTICIDLILQTFFPISIDVFRFGVYGFAIFALLTTYAIVKHGLLNVRVIASEIFAAAMFVSAIVELLYSRTIGQIVLRGIIAFGVSVFGFLHVRSVIEEVRRREQIELLAQNLKAANDQLAALNEMKSNFVSIASHQLRAPIGGVRGYLLLMREGDYGKLGAKIGKVIDQCTDQLDHLLHVVNMFLDVTKMEAGKLVLERKDTDLRELATSAAADNELGVRNKGLTLSLALPPRAVTLSVDGPKLRDVMYNFIENAVKYTTKGTIEVSVAVVGTVAEFRVKDSGMGIAEEEVPKLFAKFIRAGGGFRVAHGSGLGLYIAKTITEAHGGEVFVESAGEGKGSTFGCRLPLRKAAKRRRG